MRTRYGFILILFLTGMLHAQAGVPKDLVRAYMISDSGSIQAGKPFKVGVMLRIQPHWHVYWKNVGDAGIPTTVDFHLPEGFTAGPLQYPVPSRIEQSGNIVMYGYTDEVMLIAEITPPAQILESKVTINADVSWLVCDDSCIPGSDKLQLQLLVGKSEISKDQLPIRQWEARVPAPIATAGEVASQKQTVTMDTSSVVPSGTLSITIEWKDQPPAKINWFPPAVDRVLFNKVKIGSSGKMTTIVVGFDLTGKKESIPPSLESVLAYESIGQYHGFALPVQIVPSN